MRDTKFYAVDLNLQHSMLSVMRRVCSLFVQNQRGYIYTNKQGCKM